MRQISIIKSKGVVLFLSVSALIIPIVLIEIGVLKFTNGKLIYPLDDTYIHLSIAKNLALHNNWGISANEFQSASSSILYTVLLSILFKLFSVNAIIPFIINLAAGVILLIVIQQRLQKENIGFTGQFITSLLVIFFTPLPMLIISGMEHTLQCLFSLLFIFNFSDWMSANQNNISKKTSFPKTLFLYGIVLCALRYEGLFIIAVASCVLLYYRKIISAFTLGFVSALPLILFGIFSITKGSYFLPNSVLLKSSPMQLSGGGFVSYINDILIDKLTFARTGITALATQRLLLILPLAYMLLRNQIGNSLSYKLVVIFLTLCTILQLAFAATGWFYRYEAYLVLCSVVFLSMLFFKYFKRWSLNKSKFLLSTLLIVAFFLLFPLILRSTAAYAKAKQACINIYEQQYQMGNFIKKYYDTNTVAVNDIGAVSYLNQSKIIDLWGLANIEIATAKKNNYSTPQFLNTLVNNEGVNFAIVYDSWFDSALLNKWQKIATWQIANNVICGDATVSFYAVKSNSGALLKTNLLAYQQFLPADVKVKYYYIDR